MGKARSDAVGFDEKSAMSDREISDFGITSLKNKRCTIFDRFHGLSIVIFQQFLPMFPDSSELPYKTASYARPHYPHRTFGS